MEVVGIGGDELGPRNGDGSGKVVEILGGGVMVGKVGGCTWLQMRW